MKYKHYIFLLYAVCLRDYKLFYIYHRFFLHRLSKLGFHSFFVLLFTCYDGLCEFVKEKSKLSFSLPVREEMFALNLTICWCWHQFPFCVIISFQFLCRHLFFVLFFVWSKESVTCASNKEGFPLQSWSKLQGDHSSKIS